MIGALKWIGIVMVVLFLPWGNAQAMVSVSPVIVEAVGVAEGQTFEVLCQNWGDQPIEMQLSLALFDQSETGGVVFLEDPEAVHRASGFLTLHTDALSLDPNGEDVVRVELIDNSFDNLYAVLFVKPRQVGVQTRFAVLFLLSTSVNKLANMTVSSWVQQEDALTLTVENHGLRHGLWEGEVHLYDASDQVGEKRQITSGVVLAGRSRGVQVPLPSWVRRVEVFSDLSGQQR